MRGKGYVSGDVDLEWGITPAYAWKSTRPHDTANEGWDHPRLCGEKTASLSASRRCWGSPPPMRGKDSLFIDCTTDFRITPAYAGKSYKISIL